MCKYGLVQNKALALLATIAARVDLPEQARGVAQDLVHDRRLGEGLGRHVVRDRVVHRGDLRGPVPVRGGHVEHLMLKQYLFESGTTFPFLLSKSHATDKANVAMRSDEFVPSMSMASVRELIVAVLPLSVLYAKVARLLLTPQAALI